MNSKYKRMLTRLPDELREILGDVKSDCTVENYASQYMGWTVDIIIKSHRYNLVREWHQILVAEVDGMERKHIWPENAQDTNVGIEHVAGFINELSA